jgi:hypothetical protein
VQLVTELIALVRHLQEQSARIDVKYMWIDLYRFMTAQLVGTGGGEVGEIYVGEIG